MQSKYLIYGKFENINNTLQFSHSGMEFEMQNISWNIDNLNCLIKGCDGNTPLSNIIKYIPEIKYSEAKDLLDGLVDNGLGYINHSGRDFISGDEAIFLIEDLQAKLLYSTLYKNKFWTAMQSPNNVPEKVYYGMAIENYHFLFRESWFDSPVLSFLPSTKSRLIMNGFYGEEYGHDELILNALNHIDIERSDISETLPLPETLALCNALAFWSANDPLFFFSTMGILEGKDIKVDS
ncbi:hypothetical protein, partial [Xenorhabdus bovienii]|uniref:Uncharacterized protein n=1 Tax=Xenorhabdus bovienii str. feltiae Moldova TaxID=1398200 RepID=A0A077NBN4_XENBV